MTKSIEQKIEEAQEIGRQRWNRMVQREERQARRELAAADRAAKRQRARMRVVDDASAKAARLRKRGAR